MASESEYEMMEGIRVSVRKQTEADCILAIGEKAKLHGRKSSTEHHG